MKGKKFAALMTALVLAAMTITGCGNTQNGSSSTSGSNDTVNTNKESQSAANDTQASDDVEDVHLKVWTASDEFDMTTEMLEKFKDLHPEYNFTYELIIVGVDESTTLLVSDPDIAADVFYQPSGAIPELTQAGLLYPITYNQENINTIYGTGALTACTGEDGLLYGIPFTPNSWFMYYNKSMFNEEEIKSLEVMLDKDLGDGVLNFGLDMSNSWYVSAFFYAGGCTLFGANGDDPADCTWNSENGYKVGEYIIDLAQNPRYLEDADGLGAAMFKAGELGAMCSGTWMAGEFSEALGDDYAAAALPSIKLDGKDCQLSNFSDYKMVSVKANTAHPLAAQQLAVFLANEENQLIRYEEIATTPTILSLVDHPSLLDDPASSALLAQTRFATAQPAIPQLKGYWTPAEALATGMVNGEITRTNLQENLDTFVNQIINQ